MITFEDFKKPYDSVVRLISEVLPKSKYRYFTAYRYRSIDITDLDTDSETRLYIKIVYIGNGFAVDLSNITLDEKIRHKGIFTNIVNNLKKSRSIKEIWVTSVLTPEMHEACQKLGFKPDELNLNYKYKI